MEFKLSWLVAFLSSVLVAAPLMAQGTPSPVSTVHLGSATSTGRIFQNYIYGVVKKVTKTKLVLGKTVQGIDQTYRIVHKTKFIQNGKSVPLKNIKVGEGVFVETKKDKKTGDVMAMKIMTGIEATNLH